MRRLAFFRRTFRPAFHRAIVLFFALWLPAASISAQQVANPLYRAVEDYLRTQTQGFPGKVSYRITPLDTRTQQELVSSPFARRSQWNFTFTRPYLSV